MGAPVQIPDLPAATVANDNDETILRQGLVDFRVTIGLIRNLNIDALTPLSGSALGSDRFLISRGGSNFRIDFSAVGLPLGTKTWLYMTQGQIDTVMLGWQSIPNSGNALLAVRGGSVYTTAGTTQGTWTQPAINLLIGQIPAHQHGYPVSQTRSLGTSSTKVSAANNGASTDILMKTYHTGGVGSAVGSSNPKAYSDFNDSFSPDTDPVQADPAWRPFAAVGMLAVKIV